ncbi:u3 small nucleolar ribonucleoprotein imp4 [Anaeramoeba ignava]|uniref:U3 small nucleolar ribonucleoprotein imp4 n=1 Tax=Anaeramoeba ignava TaxID=1746090 RepID=A0A9Q0RDU5_ANAIG|nr:u3 small nucleolar ribonucleoprotein imp4 [Anaeramoeba ignava]
MIRRNVRLRKEYLYRKSLEGKERIEYEQKKMLKEALEEEKPISKDIAERYEELHNKIEGDDEYTGRERLSIDDEYMNSGITDPKVLITTSRNPSSRLSQFAKEIKLIFPNSERINRGKHVVHEITQACRANEMTDLILLHEHQGEPDGMIISHFPYGPTAYFGLINTVLRHDIKGAEKMSETYPHLIFHKFTTKIGERVQTILKYLFPVPKDSSKRIITFANDQDVISFRHHIYKKEDNEILLKEIGPRFEMKLFCIKLGTVEIEEADKEYIVHPYINSKKNVL